MKRPQYVFRPNLNDPQHRRAWALLQQVPPAKRKEFLVQSIKQILEPICEAKFSNNSYGFRPNRSVEHAISRTYSLLQRAHLHYVLEFDIKGFFDNVNHSKLIRQLWSLGIQDKQLLFVIKRILKAPIRMPDGTTEYPTKGTPQGGIISPLLANVVLNELDHWIDSQWVEHPLAVSHAYRRIIRTSEVIDKSKGYVMMRRTGLKEMFIVRYADDFRIFCRNREDAERTMASVTQWITERLHLEVSPEKTRIVNVRKRYSEFLGFKIRVFRKGEKYVVRSHICDKKLQLEERKLVEQAKHIANPTEGKSQPAEIGLFDEMVLGIYNRLQCNQKTILEPLVDDLLGLRHLQEQKYKKRLALGEDIQHLAKQKHNLTRIHTLGYIEEPQFIERSAAIEQQIRERKQQLSRNDMSNTSEKILQKTRLIQKKLSSTPPLELFDESVFKELVKKVLISNTAIQFELINGMKLSESRAAT